MNTFFNLFNTIRKSENRNMFIEKLNKLEKSIHDIIFKFIVEILEFDIEYRTKRDKAYFVDKIREIICELSRAGHSNNYLIGDRRYIHICGLSIFIYGALYKFYLDLKAIRDLIRLFPLEAQKKIVREPLIKFLRNLIKGQWCFIIKYRRKVLDMLSYVDEYRNIKAVDDALKNLLSR